MRQEFPVTRWVLVLAALVGAGWLAASLLTSASEGDATAVHAPQPPAPTAREDPAPLLTDWEAELLAPDIQALWQARRRRLDDLSRRYRAAADTVLAAALRCSMELLIARSEREVYELRLAHARRAGRTSLVRRLERVLADLPAGTASAPATTATEVARPGGPSP